MPHRDRILYLSSVVPRSGTGGGIVLRRHLERLEASGFSIVVAVPEQSMGAAMFPASWQIIVLPARRLWWPPARASIPYSLNWRAHLWKRELQRAIGQHKPRAIITVLWDYYALVASRLSAAIDVPLSLIVHDEWDTRAESKSELTLIRQYTAEISAQAQRIWAVSPAMAKLFGTKPREQISVLYPIPDGNRVSFVEWQAAFSTRPVVAHVASLFDFHIPYLRALAAALERKGGNLLIVARSDNPALVELQNACPNIVHHEYFANNLDVLEYIATTASALTICYPSPLELHPWERVCFPSRLAEFSHLGLPILINAPAHSSLGDWAKEQGWLAYVKNNDQSAIASVIMDLTCRDAWLRMSLQTRRVAAEEFAADKIHRQFESELALAPV